MIPVNRNYPGQNKIDETMKNPEITQAAARFDVNVEISKLA
jgi:hypothetical protein